jgi:hypothetical protein
MARMSPFSQTVDSRSWSTFYSEELSFGITFQPLVPQHCLHLLWTSDPLEDERWVWFMFRGCGFQPLVRFLTSDPEDERWVWFMG